MIKQALNNSPAVEAPSANLKPPRLASRTGRRGYLLGAMLVLMLLAGIMTAGVAAGKFSWVALLFPVVLAIGFGLGVSSPRIALALVIVSVLSEGFQPNLMTNGDITIRFDELIAISVTCGVMVRHIRAGTGALPRLLRAVPGLIPLLLFLAENIVVTLLGRKNVGYGFGLIAELAAGILLYIGIVLLLSEIKRPRDIIMPLLLSAGFEACFGLGALGLAYLLHDPTIFGVHRDTTSLLVAPYGTFIEPNFFGHYMAAITIIVFALLLYVFTRRRRSLGAALALIVVGGLAIAGVLASLTRTSWVGLALGILIVLAIWRVGRKRYETTAKKRRSPEQTARLRWIIGVTVAVVVAAASVVLGFTSEGEALATRFSHLFDFTSGSGFGRLKVLDLVLNDWLQNPLLGLGTGSFTGHLPGVPPSPHTWIYSMGLAMLHDSGSLGVEIFLFFLFGLYSALWRSIRGTPTSSVRALAVGLFGASLFMLFGAQATSSMYLMLLWLFLGLAAGMPILCASASWHRLIMAGPSVTLSALDATLTDPATKVLPAIPKGAASVEARMTAIPAPTRGRVLHIYDTGMLGGMQRILLATARGLTKYGWASTAIVGDDGPLANDLRKVGVRAIALPIAGKRRFTLSFFTLFWRILQAQADVVIVYGAVVGCVAGLAARLAGVRCVVYQSGSPTFYYNWTRFRRLRNALVERIACGCASAVWSVSQENRQLYLTNNAAPAYKFVEIPLCVSQDLIERLRRESAASAGGIAGGTSGAWRIQQLSPVEGSAALRAQFGLAAHERVIGYVGRLVPEKGVDVLLDAFAQVAHALPNTRLLLVGDGPARDALWRQTHDLGVGQRVIFAGPQHDVVPFYLLSDVVVVPSHRETFGLVGVEALIAGRPVVGSWVGGLPEAIVDGESGRLVPPGDSGALAAAIQWVLEAPQRARELGRVGQQQALDGYTEALMAARVHALLDLLTTINAKPWQLRRRAGDLELSYLPRTVLHILDSGAIGGGPRVLLAAARGMREHNWLSSVVCGNDGPLGADLRAAGIPTTEMSIAGQFRFLFGMPRLISYMSRHRPDVVIVYGPIAGCLGGLAARLAGVKGVVYGAGYPSYYADRGPFRRIRNAVVEKISAGCADVVWCKSTADVRLYRERKASRPDKFRLAPNCVSNDLLDRFAEYAAAGPASVDPLRMKLGLATHERVIGYVGRLVPEKGVDVLLDSFAQVAHALPNTRLLLVGEGPTRDALQRQAQALGLGDRVIFAGPQHDIVPFYLLADVIAIPSLYEPFGNVAVEAMAGARAVVASRVGGLADTILDGECGRLVPPRDADALAQALLWVLEIPQRSRELGRAGRQRALSEYTEARLAERLDHFAHEALRP